MRDQLLLEPVQELLSGLSQPVYLLDASGRSLVPALPDTFLLPPGRPSQLPVSHAGYLYLGLSELHQHTLATKMGPGARDILLLCARLLRQAHQYQQLDDEWSSALRLLMAGQLSLEQLEKAAQDRGVQVLAKRRALLISLPIPQGGGIQEALAQAIPMAQGDVLVSINPTGLLLARDSSQDEGEDLFQYALALLDTIHNEVGLHAQVGISGPTESLMELPKAQEQAREAISIGRMMRRAEQVHVYDRLTWERFLAAADPALAGRFSKILFNQDTSKLFSEEMLDTVRTMLDFGLNLTEASRELYIHRNTLVYRLDKILRETGLDLRQFKDAMVFKLLLDLHKIEQRSGQ